MSAPTKDEIRQRVARILEQSFGVEPTRVKDDASFRGAFAMDSADLIDFIDMLEREFGLAPGLEGYEKMHTVKHLVAFLARELGSAD